MHCTCLLLLLPPPVCNLAEYRPRTCMFSRIFRSVLVSASGLFGRVASACPSGRKGAPASELSFASCGPIVTRAFSRAVPCPSSLGVCVRCPGCSYRLVFASPVTTSPVTLAGPNTQTHTRHLLILGLELQSPPPHPAGGHHARSALLRGVPSHLRWRDGLTCSWPPPRDPGRSS